MILGKGDYIMKKALKRLAIAFCVMGLIAYTSMMFTEDPDMHPVFIVGDVVLLVLLILLLRKKRSKAQTIVKSSEAISKPIEPKKVSHSAKLDDTSLQCAKRRFYSGNRIRIHLDCS